MYKSPIELKIEDIVSDVTKQVDEYTLRCFQKIGVNVDKYELIKALEYDRGFRDGYAEALKETDNVPDKNVGEWIPCSERLPDKKGRYLCTVDAEYHNVREMMYDPDEFISEEDRSIWKDTDGYRVFNWFVIAWMPMPKPYKMDEVEKDENN